MKLTQKEMDRLTIFTIAEMARKYRQMGIRLNYPEAVALICDEMMMAARGGASYEAVLEMGAQVLTREDVMDGVPEILTMVQVEPLFPDGTKLVTVHNPVRN